MEPSRGAEKSYDGFWGRPTATIDWCEANYEVNEYIAEFWNTISNLFMIVPPLVGAILAVKDKLETRFVCSQLSLMVVGIGSALFHGTLKYEMQLLDELPMIWGSAILLYNLMEVGAKPGSHNYQLQLVLFIYCTGTTIIYLGINRPIFHEIAYAGLVFSMIGYSIRIVRHFEHSTLLVVTSLVTYALGFVLWNIDNIFCAQLRDIRAQVPSIGRPIFQGHAWWHILAGLGTYVGLLFCMHARLLYLKRPAKLQMGLGVWAYLRSDDNPV